MPQICEVGDCLEDGTQQCEVCGPNFCRDHGQVGGDRQVVDVGTIAYPDLCANCLGKLRR